MVASLTGTWGRNATFVVAYLVLVAAPGFLAPTAQRTLLITATLAMIACGLNFVMGQAGQFALSHVFFYGAAAYLVGIVATRQGQTDFLVLLAMGIAAAVVLAVVTGIPGFRLASWTLGLVTFFLIEIFDDLTLFDRKLTGGPTGIVGIPRFELGVVLDTPALTRLAVTLLFVWLLFQRNVYHSAYGRIFAALRQDEVQVASLGVSAYRLKVFAYVISAIPAGAAGVVFAATDGFVSPASFTLSAAILILAAVVLGGRGTMYGPLIGTWILVESQQRMLAFTEYTLLIFGGFLAVTAVVLPKGLVGTAAARLPSALRRPMIAFSASATDREVALGPEEPKDLVVTGVSKAFGGIQALDEVSIEARSGQITALIGPNGSGKTSLLNSICGFYSVDRGTLKLGAEPLQRRRPAGIARIGVGRTFQTPRLPKDLTVEETVATAAFSARRARLVSTMLRLPRWRSEERQTAIRVDEVLGEVGLRDDATATATSLPLGKKRLVEIARAVMMRPPLLVLDEAASGLDPHETERLGQLLRRLADEGTAVLLVEHNMDLVMSVAERVFVLADGRLLTSGTPGEVSTNPDVLAVYLGRDSVAEEPA